MKDNVLRLSAGALTLALLATLGGCPWESWPPPATGDEGAPKLERFQSLGEAAAYFREQAANQRRQNLWDIGEGRFGGFLAMAPPGAAADAGGEATNGGGDGAYSTTNIQEGDVDEADVFKSDGTYFYILTGALLRIVQADPLAGLAEVGTLQLDNIAGELYVAGDTVIALGYRPPDPNSTDAPPWAEPQIAIWPPYYVDMTTVVTQIDVSDRTAPTQTAQIELDGSLVTSRLTDGKLVVVTTIAPEIPDDVIGIMAMEDDDVLPGAETSAGRVPLVDVEDWYHPSSPDGYFTTAVAVLDAANVESILGSIAVMADAGTIYMSPNALYVTDDEWDSSEDYREITAIHKITFDAAGMPTYGGSGAVPGRLLNQFSLGEHDGYLRVATHVASFGWWGEPWLMTDAVVEPLAAQGADAGPPPEPYNAVYVLGDEGDTLPVVGSVENIAPGEQIYAVRFMQERGYVVTFRQIDPLFVVDLSDPNAPEVVGELKVPGFSNYLHPIGDDYLIGVGQAVTLTEWGGTSTDGIQISMFDVSDWTNPTAVQQLTVGGPWSRTDVSGTHKAFTYLDEEQLLAVPAVLYPASSYSSPADVVLCYEVTPGAGFTDLGTLSCVIDADAYTYSLPWRRAALIGRTVYALSRVGVRGASVDDLATTTTLTFTEE